jgi:ABC-type sugar transport system ATPase subunit
MRSGVLQQIGTPEELYQHPANVFVASFIGSPAMNLVPGGAIPGLGSSGQIVGFRPEHVTVRGAGGPTFDAVVEVVEYLGEDQLVHLSANGTTITAKIPAEPRLRVAETVALCVPEERLHVFDADTEEAVDARLVHA